MTVKLKFCGCFACRHWGKPATRQVTRHVNRSARRLWNKLAREGRDEEITSVSVPPSY